MDVCVNRKKSIGNKDVWSCGWGIGRHFSVVKFIKQNGVMCVCDKDCFWRIRRLSWNRGKCGRRYARPRKAGFWKCAWGVVGDGGEMWVRVGVGSDLRSAWGGTEAQTASARTVDADESKNARFLYEIYISTFPRLAKYAVKRWKIAGWWGLIALSFLTIFKNYPK